MEVGRVARIVLGVVLALLGLGLLVGGIGLGAALAFGTDDDGFFTFGPQPFSTDTHALVSGDVDLGTDPEPGDWATAEVRVRAEAPGGQPVFVGVGRADDVAAALDGVDHEVVVDVSVSPFDPRYRRIRGDAVPAPPATWDGWAATASGPGEVELEWEAESGEWALVVMRPDGTAGVSADVAIGVRVERLGTIAVAIGVIGAVLVALGVALALPAVRRRGPTAPVTVGPSGWPSAPPA